MLLSREFIITPLVACFCILGISLSQFPRLQELINSEQSMSVEALEKEQQKEALRLSLLQQIPTFGYDNLISNWVYIDFLQYFGDLLMNPSGHTSSWQLPMHPTSYWSKSMLSK